MGGRDVVGGAIVKGGLVVRKGGVLVRKLFERWKMRTKGPLLLGNLFE